MFKTFNHLCQNVTYYDISKKECTVHFIVYHATSHNQQPTNSCVVGFAFIKLCDLFPQALLVLQIK